MDNKELQRLAIAASPVIPLMRKQAHLLGMTFQRKRVPPYGGLVWQIGVKGIPDLYGEVWLHEDGGRLDQVRIIGYKPTRSLNVALTHLKNFSTTPLVWEVSYSDMMLLGDVSTQTIELMPMETGIELAVIQANTGIIDLLIQTGPIEVVSMEATLPDVHTTKAFDEMVERETLTFEWGTKTTAFSIWFQFFSASAALVGLVVGSVAVFVLGWWLLYIPIILVGLAAYQVVLWAINRWDEYRDDQVYANVTSLDSYRSDRQAA